MAQKRAKLIRSKTVFKGSVFSVRRDEIVEPDGLRATREIVTHRGSVVVMPVFPNGDVLLVRQFRYAAGESLWELVAGSREPGESPLSGARRELLEETGYTARRVRLLLEIIPTPGFLTETMAIFAAKGLTAGAAHPEEDEHIVARRFSQKQVLGMIRRGAVRDAKTVTGILYYLRFVAKRGRAHEA
ncbi:MAG: NUDIX hydrolase [Candidatus Acidiferrales bacterium]